MPKTRVKSAGGSTYVEYASNGKVYVHRAGMTIARWCQISGEVLPSMDSDKVDTVIGETVETWARRVWMVWGVVVSLAKTKIRA